MSALAEAKRKLAESMRAVRRAAHRAAGREAAGALCAAMRAARAQGLALSPGAPIAGYWPVRDEIDTRALLRGLHGEGLDCALPAVVAPGRPLVFRRWRPGDRLEDGAFGIAQPADDAGEVRPAVVLAPLLAVDRAGRRLGYGEGYYDRTLAALRAAGPVTAVGVCFADQVLREVPAEPHDQRLDWVVTERGAWRAAG